jgi:excisionase family DNA binding protein
MPDLLLQDYLEIPEAAEQLRVSQRTLQRWLEERQLPFIYIGRRRVVPIESARKAMKAREVKALGRRK